MDESQLETQWHSKGPASEPLERWGPFENLQRVGGGAFGEVYRAFDSSLQRDVALKLLLPGNREREAAAVLREARAIARLRHPNIVPVYGVDKHDGRVGFWTDFVQGQTLADILDAQGALGPREAALIGIDVCRAVGAVHAAGLVHRDIKAANVMREQGGRILLVDFGLTYEPGGGDNPAGTPVYMAPELVDGQPATVASDIYAIGVLLFNLLTTRYPAHASSRQELGAAHDSGAGRSLFDVRSDLPEALVRVIEIAIDPVPERRFASAGRMAVALSDAIGLGSAVDIVAPAPSKLRLLRPWMLVPVGVAAAAVLLVFSPLGPSSAKRPTIVQMPQAAAQDDYRRARELLAHYYRPQALETAIPAIEKVASQDAQFAPAFADLARANLLQFIQERDTKYIEPTRSAALRALALAPGMASPHVTLGALYARTSEHDLANHELQEALRLDRFNADAYGALADLYTRQGRAELVEPTLQQAVSLAPDDWNLVQQLGEHYLDTGKWEQAQTQYLRASELAPDNPRALNNLALVYRGLDRLDDSAAAFRKAIEIEPTFLHFRNLGMVLAEAGKYEEALPMLQRSIEMRPEHYRAWGLLGFVYLNQPRETAKAREAFLKAIALAADLLKQTPKNEYLLADVGGYYAALGMEKQSLPLLRQAAARAPNIPEVLYQVAVAHEMLHRRDEALQLLAKAVAGGYPAAAIARNPQLAGLRGDAQYSKALATVPSATRR